MRPARVAQAGVLLVCASLPVSGCVCEQGKPARSSGAAPREVALYDFAGQPELSMLDLWPAGSDVPGRKKRQLLTRQEGTTLLATTDGPDPFFVWDFEKPVHAGALSVEVESDTEAPLQLFWSNESCKVYEERCSTTAQLAVGVQTVDYVLDRGVPLRGLRLDLPEVRGAKLTFRRIRLLERPRVTSGFHPRAGHTEAMPSPEGLRISSKTVDPWVIFQTPWLATDQVETVEVSLRTPPDAKPELFWQGAECPHYQDKCHVMLSPTEGKPTLYSARVAEVPSWRGAIASLRLDPGDPPGDYVLEKLVLVRKGSQP